jgi:hypothetical protein
MSESAVIDHLLARIDELESRDGAWGIARRHVSIHHFNPLPGARMRAPV